jgi:serine/threonine protein phosphatase PrpC
MGCLLSKETKDLSASEHAIGRTARIPRFPTEGKEALPSKVQQKPAHVIDLRGGGGGPTSASTQNSDDTLFSKTKPKRTVPEVDENGHLLPSEVQNRRSTEVGITTCTLNTATTSINPCPIHYAICTQQGYYPDDPHKLNQDSYSVTLNFANITNGSSLFAVYDGHGPKGDIFAQFAKKQIPILLYKYVQQERAKLHRERNESLLKQDPNNKIIPFNPKLFPMLTEKEFEAASMRAHLECNKKMVDEYHKRDVNLSGTTAISAGIHDGKLIISNVGDSRAVLGYRDSEGSENKNSIIALPLSKDQTPWRKDERERVRKAGGRVLTIDQIKGTKKINDESERTFGDQLLGENDFIDTHGDPPRVWLPDKSSPGTSFTRSLGDAVADKIGVYAEPEFYSKDLTDDDKVLVLASDGVFEFVSNQSVIDICAKHSSPSDACEEIVATAYTEWLKHETRTDDITVIVIYLGDPLLHSSSVASSHVASGHVASGHVSFDDIASDDVSFDASASGIESNDDKGMLSTSERSKSWFFSG